MSQPNVERVIGVLVTDERLRAQFTRDPRSALLDLVRKGMDLNPTELWSLACLDPSELARFAQAIDARLQKADLEVEPQ
ncbi:MAG TPA: Os1348 family NHLP clan protein [Candidatus Eisenbacteria bacterium]|nr:Os1348 family NHLP clan protein [Candidatus Eisenbacteria bacterium]